MRTLFNQKYVFWRNGFLVKGALSWGGDILKNENVAFSEVNFATKNTKNSTWAHSIQLPQRTFLGLGTLPWFALYFKIQTDYFEIVFKKIKKSIVMRSSLYRLFIVHLVTFGVIVKVKKTARFCKHSYISFICNILLYH